MNTEQTERLDELARETALHNATALLKQCGYNNPQEAIADFLVLGVVPDGKNVWQKIENITDAPLGPIITKAHAKVLGLLTGDDNENNLR